MFSTLPACLACGSVGLKEILNLSNQPLANDYTEIPTTRPEFPLSLNWCEECTHMQLGVAVHPEILFKEYAYSSGVSREFERFLNQFTDHNVLKDRGLKRGIEIGSNDGTLLHILKTKKMHCLGVDPAINIVVEAAKRNLLSIPTFFDENLIGFLSPNLDFAIAFNVFAHTANPLKMLQNISQILRNEGKLFILTSQANMILGTQFDTVYHEHINFFNVKSMKKLLQRASLSLQSVELVDVHGGSYLWTIVKTNSESALTEREEYERRLKMYEAELYSNLTNAVNDLVSNFNKQVQGLQNAGHKIAIFGAAAKGSTFFNFVKLVPDFIFDDSPNKKWKFSPIGNVQVHPSEELERFHDKMAFIVPAWNVKNEIVQKLKKLRSNRGDAILTYFPKLSIEYL